MQERNEEEIIKKRCEKERMEETENGEEERKEKNKNSGKFLLATQFDTYSN